MNQEPNGLSAHSLTFAVQFEIVVPGAAFAQTMHFDVGCAVCLCAGVVITTAHELKM